MNISDPWAVDPWTGSFQEFGGIWEPGGGGMFDPLPTAGPTTPVTIGLGAATVGFTLGAEAATGGSQITVVDPRTDPREYCVTLVNQIEQVLQRNLAEYQAGDRTLSRQQTALAFYDTQWSEMVRLLSDPKIAIEGARAIADRQPGAKYDWKAYYRDPISNDTVAIDSAGIPSLFGLGPGGLAAGSPWVYAAILGLVAYLAWRKYGRKG